MFTSISFGLFEPEAAAGTIPSVAGRFQINVVSDSLPVNSKAEELPEQMV